MASPQTENGYTEIANELLEKLAGIRLSGEEMQVLLVIIRKTYGWKKKADKIPFSQISLITGLKRQSVCRAIRKLETKNMLTVNKNDDSQINTYEVQKDYEQWKPLPKRTVNKNVYCKQKGLQTVNKDVDGTVNKNVTLKRKKAIKTNTPPQKPAADPRVKELIKYFHDRYVEKYSVKPVIIGGKDGKLLKERLQLADVDAIKGMMDKLFASEDKFISGLPKTIGTFCAAAVFEKLRGVHAKDKSLTPDESAEIIRQAWEKPERAEPCS